MPINISYIFIGILAHLAKHLISMPFLIAASFIGMSLWWRSGRDFFKPNKTFSSFTIGTIFSSPPRISILNAFSFFISVAASIASTRYTLTSVRFTGVWIPYPS